MQLSRCKTWSSQRGKVSDFPTMMQRCSEGHLLSPAWLIFVPLFLSPLSFESNSIYVDTSSQHIHLLRLSVHSARWGDRVSIVAADMRYWEAPKKADILVSELLGSFGDNELSPECLDGAQRFLREDGISIPSAYTSYLQPVTTFKLWNDVKVSCLSFLKSFIFVRTDQDTSNQR